VRPCDFDRRVRYKYEDLHESNWKEVTGSRAVLVGEIQVLNNLMKYGHTSGIFPVTTLQESGFKQEYLGPWIQEYCLQSPSKEYETRYNAIKHNALQATLSDEVGKP